MVEDEKLDVQISSSFFLLLGDTNWHFLSGAPCSSGKPASLEELYLLRFRDNEHLRLRLEAHIIAREECQRTAIGRPATHL